MEIFVNSLLQTTNYAEKKEKIGEFREVSAQSYLITLLGLDEEKGLGLIRAIIGWVPCEIDGCLVVFDILDGLDELHRSLGQVVLLGWDFLYTFTKKLLGDFEIEIVEFSSREREDISPNLIADLLFLVRNKTFNALFVDEFEFCVDSLVGIHIDSAEVDQSIMYLRLMEIIYRLPKEKTTASLFDSLMESKLLVIEALCPLFVWEEHRWVLEIDSDFRKYLIRAYISWLSPTDIEGALILFDILEDPLKTCDVYAMARNFLFSLGENLLSQLQEQAIEITRGKRITFSKKLLNGFLVIVRNDTFKKLVVDGFEFCIDSLTGINVDPSDICDCMQYMRLLEIVYRLPKAKTTSQLFQSFIHTKIPVMASICPVIFMEEHRWILKVGFEFRRNLVYSLLPAVHNVFGYRLEIDRNNYMKSSIEKLLAASPYLLRMGVSLTFKNEAGRGIGVFRDWLLSLADMMVNSKARPFEISGEETLRDHSRIYPRRGARVDLMFYRCFGRLLGLAIIHKVQIGYALDKVVFLQLGGHGLTLEDIKETVPSKYRQYKELFFMNKETIQDLELYFTTDFEGHTVTPRGRATIDDLEDYIAHRIDLEFAEGIRSSISQMLVGLNDILEDQCREHIFQVLLPQDLDLILRGIKEIKLDEWIRFTTYVGYNKHDPQIIWFWECVGDMSAQEQRDLLHFWTSIAWLPAGGFKDLDPPLVIRKALLAKESDLSRLPSAQTCYCILSIPPYRSLEIMRTKLHTATENHKGSFELV